MLFLRWYNLGRLLKEVHFLLISLGLSCDILALNFEPFNEELEAKGAEDGRMNVIIVIRKS